MLFPFEGGKCRVEVLSTLGVRYQGVLKTVDAGNKSISLTNVRHYGSEGRVVEGVAPIPAKGALPADEERVIYATYICGVRRILPPELAESGPPPPSPPPPPNNLVQQPETDGANFIQPQQMAMSDPVVEPVQLQADDTNNQRYLSSLLHHLSAYLNESEAEPRTPLDGIRAVAAMEIVSAGHGSSSAENTLREANGDEGRTRRAHKEKAAKPVCRGEELIEISDDEENAHRGDEPLEGGSKNSRKRRLSTAGPKRKRKKKEKGRKHRASDESPNGEPTYFFAQYHPPFFIGIMTNAARHLTSPVYVGFDALMLARIARPRIGQLWAAPNCLWHSTGHSFVNEHYVRGRDPKGIRHFVETRGMPWINDMHINQQAKAMHYGLRLVADVKVKKRRGKMAASWEDLIGKHYVSVTNLRNAIDGVHILVEASTDPRGDPAPLQMDDKEVEVEMVRLPTGCWVCPRFVLPNINGDNGYHDEKPPFRPDAISQSGIEFVKRSRKGNYFPVAIRGGSGKPIYFIVQQKQGAVVGLLLEQDKHPNAPLFVGIRCADSIGGEVVRLGQKWRLPTPSTASYNFVSLHNRSIAPRMFGDDGTIAMDAELGSKKEMEKTMELVEVQRTRLTEGIIICQWQVNECNSNGVMRENFYVEVSAKGAIGGVQLSSRQFDGLFADFLTLAEGDSVEVEMVQLEEGCWVGPNYLLPNIYGDASLPRELQGMQVVRARSGDYLPVRIRELRGDRR